MVPKENVTSHHERSLNVSRITEKFLPKVFSEKIKDKGLIELEIRANGSDRTTVTVEHVLASQGKKVCLERQFVSKFVSKLLVIGDLLQSANLGRGRSC